MDIATIMALFTGGANAMGQMGNLGAQGLSALNSAWDAARYFQRNSDPTINDLRRHVVNQFNANQYGPYGDIEGSFGGIWGERDDGSPVQFGDMAARQTDYMLNNNPSLPALDILNNAGAMTRPAAASFSDLASGDASRIAPALEPLTSVPTNSRPTGGPVALTHSPVMPSTRVEGVAAPTGPNPQMSAPTPGPGSGVRQVASDLRGGTVPQVQAAFRGGQPGGTSSAVVNGAQRWLQNQGGVRGLMGTLKQPGNAFDNLRDRRLSQTAGLFA